MRIICLIVICFASPSVAAPRYRGGPNIIVDAEVERQTTWPSGSTVFCKDTGKWYILEDGVFSLLTMSPDNVPPSGAADWSTITNKPSTFSPASHGHIEGEVTGLTTDLSTKVDKIAGKGLSTEDYTTAEKSKLSGIASGATVGADWNTNVTNKPTLGTASAKNVPVTGDASATEVVYGTDTRLTNSRTPLAHNQAWSTITTTPTTLSGYGITDAVANTDPRLTDARTPLAHNQAESTITFTDITIGNASTSSHGYFPKLPVASGKYLKDDLTWGTFSTAWGGITGTLSSQTDLQNALNAKEPTIAAGTTSQYYRGDKAWVAFPTQPQNTTCSGTDKINAYNSSTGAFTCSTDQTSAGGSVFQGVRVSGSDWTTTQATAQNITGLSWAIAANTEYGFTCILTHTGTATGGIRFTTSGPASPASVAIRYARASSATADTITTDTAFAGAGTAACTSSCVATNVVSQIYGQITNGANAGTFQLQAFSSTSGQTVTVKRGSFCQYW